MNRIGDFSVLMSLYHKEKPEWFDLALKSITDDQTLRPAEITMVIDGPAGEKLEDVLQKYRKKYPELFNVIILPENKGLGNALNFGLNNCKHDLIARMDTDDISAPQRFEKQYRFIKNNPDVDVLNVWCCFFDGSIENIIGSVHAPIDHEGLVKIAKFRSPVRHAACFLKKSAVLNAGNYSGEFKTMQDYHLWIRMIAKGSIFASIPEELYYIRSSEFSKKRVGFKRWVGQLKIHGLMFKLGNISFLEFCRNLIVRTACLVVPYRLVMWFVSKNSQKV